MQHSDKAFSFLSTLTSVQLLLYKFLVFVCWMKQTILVASKLLHEGHKYCTSRYADSFQNNNKTIHELSIFELHQALPEAVQSQYCDKLSGYSTGWSRGVEIFEGKLDKNKGSYYANPFHDNVQ